MVYRRILSDEWTKDCLLAHYKMHTIQERPLDTQHCHLDVLCFPSLFPTGNYGQFYYQDVKLQFSEYVKSHLFNKDSRFRKNPEYVFCNLWVKEMRELSSGIYSTLKSGNRVCYGITARDFLQGIESSDQQVEANLNTMFQSVRGSKQYWYLRRSEALCMIREWGSPVYS